MHDGRVYMSREVRRYRRRAIARMVLNWSVIVICACALLAAGYISLWAAFNGGA